MPNNIHGTHIIATKNKNFCNPNWPLNNVELPHFGSNGVSLFKIMLMKVIRIDGAHLVPTLKSVSKKITQKFLFSQHFIILQSFFITSDKKYGVCVQLSYIYLSIIHAARTSTNDCLGLVECKIAIEVLFQK